MRRPLTFTRLAPGAEAAAHELLAEVRPGERAPARRPFVFANFAVTLDGRAAIAGRSRGIGDEADLEMLLELRVLADAVLIGTGTLRAEGYGRLMRSPQRRAARAAAGRAEDPVAVVVTRSGDVAWEAELFAAADQPVLVYAGAAVAAPDGVEVVRMPGCPLDAVLADLRARGVRALLCEGGPVLAGALVEAGLLDELFLTVAPLLTGEPGAPRLLEGAGAGAAARAELAWALQAGGELFLRYRL